MRSEKVERFLTDKGFKCEVPTYADTDSTVANYWRVPYEIEGLPRCMTNDKPPQLWIAEHYLDFGDGRVYHSFTLGIRNEAPQGWLDFKFYSMQESELLDTFDEKVRALFAAWRVLFELKPEAATP